MTKTNLTSPVNKNEKIVYLISVFNDGPSDAINTVITDIIDTTIIADAEYSTDDGSAWISWSGSLNVGTIANNASYSLRIRGTVTNNAANPLVNTASVVSEVPDPNPDNNTQTIETPLEVEADLSIVKTGPATIVAGTQISYTIEVENLSPNMNAQSVIITDNVDEDFIVNPEYSVDGGSNWLAWNGALNIETLNFGDNYTLIIRGDVLSDVNQNITNTASVGSNTPDPDNTNNTSSVTTTVETEADIVVMKELVTLPHELIAGGEIVYRITYSNNGPSDATNYMVYDDVPGEISDVEASRCESGYLQWNGSVNFGTVVAGGECTVLIRGTLNSNYSGEIENIATVSSEVDDPVLSNNTSQTNDSVYTVADLAVVKTAIPEVFVAGETVTYSIILKNNGFSDAQDVLVTDNLPSNLDFISATSSSGTWSAPEWNIGTLVNGASESIEIQARVKADVLQGSTISNTSFVTSTTHDSITDNNSSTIINSVDALANVSVVKTADLAEVTAGENITYTITVNNPGPSDAQSVLVSDNLPPGLVFVSSSTTAGSFTAPGWDVGTLAAGTSESLEITAQVKASVPSGSQIENTAVVSGPTPDPVPDDNTSTTTTNVTASADLALTKTATPNPFVAGETMVYTITLGNNGPSDAQNITVSDNLPSELDFVSASTSAGTWAGTNWTIGALPAGSSQTLTIEANLQPDVPQSATVVNTASVTSGTPDPETENNTATHTGDVNAIADLSVDKTAQAVALAGDTIVYAISVENAGPSYAQDVELSDLVPGSIQDPEYSTNSGDDWNSWTTTYAYGELTNDSGFSILLRGVLNEDVAEGSILSNTATVESVTTDPNTSNNSDTETQTVTTESDLSVEKTGPVTIVAGTKITYGLTVLNNGPSDAANTEIEDVLPAGVTNGEYSLNNGNSWQPWGGLRTLPVFSATPGVNNILIRGDVSPSATGSLLNTATVSSGTPDPELGNNESDATTTIETSSDLVLAKTALTSPVNKNEEIVYGISVFNDGPSDATNTVITDVIDPAIIAGAEYSTDGGSNWDSWTGSINAGTLSNGGTYSLRIRGVVANTAASPLENTASVTSDVTDPEPDNNTQTIETPLETEADLRIVKTAPESIIAGTQITYTIEVSNLSPNMDATSVVVTDNINSTFLSNPEYSVDEGNSWIAWGGSLNLGTLDFGGNYSFQIRVDVQSNASGNIDNTAKVSSNTPDPDNSNNTSTVSTEVNKVSDVEVIKELVGEQSNLNAGSEIVYRLTYINNGPSDATNYMVYDEVPSSITNVEASRCESGFVPWSGSANMGTVVTGGECTVLIRGTINSDFNGSITNTATVSSDATDPDLDNNTSSVTHEITSYADLSITKRASGNQFVAGTTFPYIITVTNKGVSDAHDVVVTDELPSELIVESIRVDEGTWSAPEWNIGILENGSSVSMRINVRVRDNISQGARITNTATVTSSTTDPVLSNNSATRTITINAISDLQVIKTADKEEVTAGETLTYNILVQNNGPSDAVDVYVDDYLPSGLSAERITTSKGNWSAPVWDIATLRVGDSEWMEIIARVDPGISNGSIISNTASVHSSTSDPDEENNTSTVTTRVSSAYNLDVTKTASSSSVVAGEAFTYTINVENNGPSHATNLLISDTIPEYLEFVDGTANAQLANGVVTWNIGQLNAGSRSELRFTVQVHPDTPDGTEIRNVAFGITETNDTIESNPNIVTVISNTDFSVLKKADKQIVKVDETVNYEFTVRNLGEQTAENAVLIDTLSADLSFVNATGNYSVSGDVITWQLGDIAQNDIIIVSFVARVKTDTPNGTVIPNTAFASSTNIDEDAESNTELITVESYADFSIRKIAHSDTVNAGENIEYTIHITNNGPSVSNNTTISDELPESVTFVSASDNGELSDYTVIWNIHTLEVGQSDSVTLVVQTDPALPRGTVVYNTAVVQSDETETPKSDTKEVIIDNYYELNVEKIAQSGTVYPGDSITYFIDVSNNGPGNAHNISIVDELPPELSFVSADNDGFYADGSVSWEIDSIVANTTLRLSVEVLVEKDVEQETEIRNIALAFKPDVDEPEGTDTSIVVVDYDYELLITKTSSDTAVFAGNEIDYNISLYNNGEMDLYDLSVADTLQGNVEFVSASHDALYSNGVINWNIPEIKAGEQVELLTTVKVDEETEAGTLIYNVAWLSDNYTDESHISDTTIVEVISETGNNDPGLFVSKTTTSSQAHIGDTIQYSIEVSNIGTGIAYNVSIHDSLPAELTFVSASDGGQLIDVYLVEWLIGNLDEGQSKEVLISAIINESAEEGGVVANYAVTSGENRDTTVVDNPAVVDVGEDFEIVANDDYSHVDYFFEGTAIFNILENDSLNGNVATLTNVEISNVDDSGHSDIRLDINTGEVTIAGTIPTGTYQITYRICEIEDPDNCDDAVITIEITDNCEMIIPDGFSPNGDGVGDYFRITCIDRYPKAKIEIFNRWGNMVYSKENYGNIEMWGEQNAWWDGHSQHSFDLSDDLLPVGTYFYILRLDNTQKPKTGSIFLNR
ncbi:MAG: DUF11 domain-containing protein [Prolixibacteraceae bacterium]|nr:DUF11 domain-containing protein [Prolixibacteraceae bacterium]